MRGKSKTRFLVYIFALGSPNTHSKGWSSQVHFASFFPPKDRMVKALDNSLVNLEVMPGNKQDGTGEGTQQGNQG